MESMQILVLGPDGDRRAGLEKTLVGLGHRVVGCESSWAHEPPRAGEVVVLDLRERDEDWRRMSAALRTDERPLLVVADQPRRLMWTLSDRPAGMMVMTGDESERGYRVALRVCEALRERRRERTLGAATAPGLATL